MQSVNVMNIIIITYFSHKKSLYNYFLPNDLKLSFWKMLVYVRLLAPSLFAQIKERAYHILSTIV